MLEDKVEEFLNEHGWSYEKQARANGKHASFSTGVTARESGEQWRCELVVNEHLKAVLCVSHGNFTCPDERRVEMALLVANCNLGQWYGTIDYDRRTGKWAYRVVETIDKEENVEGILWRLVRYNFAGFELCAPVLRSILSDMPMMDGMSKGEAKHLH